MQMDVAMLINRQDIKAMLVAHNWIFTRATFAFEGLDRTGSAAMIICPAWNCADEGRSAPMGDNAGVGLEAASSTKAREILQLDGFDKVAS
jgi:hypothetical protein